MRTLILVITLLVAVGSLRAQQAASKPASQPAGTPSAERIENLLGLIEGQNTPQARQTGVHELLHLNWPETPDRLAAILTGQNTPARIAVATALAELPEALTAAYIDPLLTMLGDESADVRSAAATALAAYRDHGVSGRLREIALAEDKPRLLRLAAIDSLGLMTKRQAVEALVRSLDVQDSDIARRALGALERATAMTFRDAKAAREWWAQSQSLSLEEWQQLQIERLVRKAREDRRKLATAEIRLTEALEAGFDRASDAERTTLLASYLGDSTTAVRMLGLRLAQRYLAEGKTLPQPLRDQVRGLLDSPLPVEKAAAIRTVTSFRESVDAKRFADMWPGARSMDVRVALLNGLGYVGTAESTGLLLRVLDKSSGRCLTEAVAAIGRLAERGVLEDTIQSQVVAALLSAYEKTTSQQVELRERVLWAMANVGESHFAKAFTEALNPQEAVAVRQAAVRGIAGLAEPKLADALVQAIRDPDAAVRKIAVETLAAHAHRDAHLNALWQRLVSGEETDKAIRQTLWRGVLDILMNRSGTKADAWIVELPTAAGNGSEHVLELLQRLAQRIEESEPPDRARLAQVRTKLAQQLAAINRPNEALDTYLLAFADAHAAESASVRDLAFELLRFALATKQYDERVATALALGNPGIDLETLWKAIQEHVEQRMTPEHASEIVTLLDAIEQYPPGEWPAETLEKIATLRRRALALQTPQTPAEAQAPTSAPANSGA